ncbi:hypothetical protein NQ315_008058 [Exocentrus adspersus]|uniref:Uncharacterized protein n=1 Tax=Exocentrus adspersus TaxID=1586481 RepID=A0AAV8VVZ6_9CUCU|nr:hypothetical protein NQ315_008058 [Exocentrus adspersus]
MNRGSNVLVLINVKDTRYSLQVVAANGLAMLQESTGGGSQIFGGACVGHRKTATMGAPLTAGRGGTPEGGGDIQAETGDYGESELAR